MWGKKDEPAFMRKDPAQLTPMLEEEGLPQRVAVGELRDHAVPLQQARSRPALPDRSGERAMTDSAMFYLTGPSIRSWRAPPIRRSASPSTRARSATSDADDDMKAKAQKDAEAALAQPLEAYRAFFLDGRRFIGGDRPRSPTSASPSTLEFLRAIDYDFPAWAKEYMSAVEAALGDAYSEPAADVRGYVAQMRG